MNINIFVLHEILCLMLICVVFELLLMSSVYIEILVEMLDIKNYTYTKRGSRSM